MGETDRKQTHVCTYAHTDKFRFCRRGPSGASEDLEQQRRKVQHGGTARVWATPKPPEGPPEPRKTRRPARQKRSPHPSVLQLLQGRRPPKGRYSPAARLRLRGSKWIQTFWWTAQPHWVDFWVERRCRTSGGNLGVRGETGAAQAHSGIRGPPVNTLLKRQGTKIKSCFNHSIICICST